MPHLTARLATGMLIRRVNFQAVSRRVGELLEALAESGDGPRVQVRCAEP